MATELNVIQDETQTIRDEGYYDLPFEVSHNVEDSPGELRTFVSDLLGDRLDDVTVIRITKSLCPYCVDEENFRDMRITAIIFAEDNKVMLLKECKHHGTIEDVYWGDYEMFKEARVAGDFANHLTSSHVYEFMDEKDIQCPKMCGLCPKHKSHTGLGNIVVTNRCDLDCWYCFFYAKEGEPIYEPTLDQIRQMLRNMKNEKPTGANAIQITGGEPTVREDIVDIVEVCKEEGYDHIQFNCHGISFAKDPQLAKDCREAGASVVYMSFDGINPRTNNKNYWETPRTLDALRDADMGCVLVPTVIGGVNTDQLGDIIRFGANNSDIVRGVNFQPVSLVGRMPDKLRERQRVSIPDACRLIEEQTGGQIRMEDWFTVPITTKVSKFVEAMKGEETYNLSIHYSCGVGTYVFIDREAEELVPITKFLDVHGMLDYLEYLADKIEASKVKSVSKVVSGLKLLRKLDSFIDEENTPMGMDLSGMLFEAFTRGNYEGLAEFHHNSIFLGMMHFMDPYNYDIDRVERCDIHYAMPDGRVVPFCSFNVIPELYRDRVQREYSISPSEWAERNPQYVDEDGNIIAYESKYKRDMTAEYKEEIRGIFDEAVTGFKPDTTRGGYREGQRFPTSYADGDGKEANGAGGDPTNGAGS